MSLIPKVKMNKLFKYLINTFIQFKFTLFRLWLRHGKLFSVIILLSLTCCLRMLGLGSHSIEDNINLESTLPPISQEAQKSVDKFNKLMKETNNNNDIF